MADHTFGPLLLYIGKKRSVHNPVKFRLLIHKVDHTQVKIIRPQTRQQILKGRLDLLHVPGADVLPLLPGGAEVPLDDPPLPLPGDGSANIRPHIGLRHPAVQNVDPLGLTAVNDRFYLLRIMALQPLRSKADFADFQPRLPQFSVSHSVLLPFDGTVRQGCSLPPAAAHALPLPVPNHVSYIIPPPSTGRSSPTSQTGRELASRRMCSGYTPSPPS